LIDLDYFKRINDTFGHPTGDEVLRTFAIAMFANVREIDIFGRYGGEEFMLLMPETSHADAVRLVDRLRMIFADVDWSAVSPGLSISISAGVTSLTLSDTADSLLARVDAALYTAKRNGRNRVVGTE
jgi:diguanylate cyclase (GGDEF)-like protein